VFRPADIVVSTDGATYVEGTKANEFMPGDKDTGRLHELLAELADVHRSGRKSGFAECAQFDADVKPLE
jgi:hypothetical protein